MTDISDLEANRIKALEQSLINFLTDKRDAVEKAGSGYKRIRTLQLRIDNTVHEHPLFIVQMGMFEAEFEIRTGLKEKGSCYGLERFIRDWSERESVRGELLDLAEKAARPDIFKAAKSSKLSDNIGFIL